MKLTLPKDKKILLSFLLPCFFWIYLLFSTHMDIRHDAVQFEYLGKVMANEGWAAFLKQGPTLEPLYPWIISLSMKMGAVLGISYQKIQSCFQIFLLFITQILLYQSLCL